MALEIEVLKGDLTAQKVDAIVNPANSRGEMGGGVAGAIRRAGGKEIERQAVAQAPIPVGRAVVTTAGSLAARYVIHAPTMEKPAQRTSAEAVRKATRAALEAAEEHGLASLAIPGMGTGVGRVPVEEAARAIVETVRGFPAKRLQKVLLVDRNEAMVAAFQQALEGPPGWSS